MLIIVKQKNVALSEFVLHDMFENLSHIEAYKYGSVTYRDKYSRKIFVRKTSRYTNKVLFELLNGLENLADQEDYVIVTLQSDREYEFLNVAGNAISTNVSDYAPCIIDSQSSTSSQLLGAALSLYSSYGLMVIANATDKDMNRKLVVESMPKYVVANYSDVQMKHTFYSYSPSYSFTWNVASVIGKLSNIQDLMNDISANDYNAVKLTPQAIYCKANQIGLILITEYNMMIMDIDLFYELDNVMLISNTDAVPTYFETQNGIVKSAALSALTMFE